LVTSNNICLMKNRLLCSDSPQQGAQAAKESVLHETDII